MENNTKKLLSGVKVVELSTHVAAPSAARLLGDWGAEVIKVESPSGDPMRLLGSLNGMPCSDDENLSYDIQNANKTHMSLNLKNPEGYAVFHRLLTNADVFITNLRTKALTKMKLSYEELSSAYPGLVFAQVLGFGEKGPAKDNPGYDYTAYFARGGVLGTIYEQDTSPINPVTGFGDYQAGMCLTSGIMAALYNKQRTGAGEKITVSLHHTAIYMMGIPMVSSQYAIRYPATRKNALYPTVNTYKTKDDRWLQVCAPAYNLQYNTFVRTIGRADLVDEPRYSTTGAIAQGGNSARLVEIFESEFVKKNLQEWLDLFSANDLPCEKAYLYEEILEDEQAWANDCLRKLTYPSGQERIMVTPPVRFQSMGLPQHQISVPLGADSKTVLQEYGYNEEEIRHLLSCGAVYAAGEKQS